MDMTPGQHTRLLSVFNRNQQMNKDDTTDATPSREENLKAAQQQPPTAATDQAHRPHTPPAETNDTTPPNREGQPAPQQKESHPAKPTQKP